MNSLVWMSEEKRAEYDWLKHEQEESKKEKGKAKGERQEQAPREGQGQGETWSWSVAQPLLIFRRTSWGSTRSFWTKAFADWPPLLKKIHFSSRAASRHCPAQAFIEATVVHLEYRSRVGATARESTCSKHSSRCHFGSTAVGDTSPRTSAKNRDAADMGVAKPPVSVQVGYYNINKTDEQLCGENHKWHVEQLGRDCVEAMKLNDLGMLCLCGVGTNRLDKNHDAHLGNSVGFRDKYGEQNVSSWLKQVIQECCKTSMNLEAYVLGPYAIVFIIFTVIIIILIINIIIIVCNHLGSSPFDRCGTRRGSSVCLTALTCETWRPRLLTRRLRGHASRH